MKKLTYRIKELADQRGWREKDLVERTGLANLTVRNLLKGYTAAAYLGTLEVFMDAFELDDPGQLFSVTEQ